MASGFKKNKSVWLVVLGLLLSCQSVNRKRQKPLTNNEHQVWKTRHWRPLTTGQHQAILASHSAESIFYTIRHNDSVKSYQQSNSVRKEILEHHLEAFQIRSSSDGNVLGFVSQSTDAKGDIYYRKKNWIGIWNERKITDRQSEDIDVDVSRSGRLLVYSGRHYKQDFLLYLYDTKDEKSSPLGIHGVGARFSPDEKHIVYAWKGDLYSYSFVNKSTKQITLGPAIDSFPVYSPDQKRVYFTRKLLDTNRDSKVDAYDKSSLWYYDLEQGRTFQETSVKGSPTHLSIYNGELIASFEEDGSRNLRATTFLKDEPNQRDYQRDVYFTDDLYSLLLDQDRASSVEKLSWTYWQLRQGQVNAYRQQIHEDGKRQDNWSRSFESKPWIDQEPKALNEIARACDDDKVDILCLVNKGLLHIKLDKKDPDLLKSISNTFQSSRTTALPKQMLSDLWIVEYLLGRSLLGEKTALKQFDSKCQYLYPDHKSFLSRSLDYFALFLEESFDKNYTFSCQSIQAFRELRALKKEADDFKNNSYTYKWLSLLKISGHDPLVALQALQALQKSPKLREFLDKISAEYQTIRPSLKEVSTQRQLSETDEILAGLYLEAGHKMMNIKESGLAVDFYRRGLKIAPKDAKLVKAIVDSYALTDRLEYFTEDKLLEMQLDPDSLSYIKVYLRTYDIDQSEKPIQKLEIINELILEMNEIDVDIAFKPSYHQTLGWLYYQKQLWTEELSRSGIVAATRRFFVTALSYFSKSNEKPLQQSIYQYELAKSYLGKDNRGGADLNLNLASAYFNLKRFERASEFYEKRLNKLATYSMSPDLKLATLIQAARSAFQAEYFSISSRRFTEAIILAEKLGKKEIVQTYRIFLGRSLFYEKNYKHLEQLYQNELPGIPKVTNDVHFDILKAEYLVAEERFTDAKEILDQAEIKLTRLFDVSEDEASDRISISLSGENSNTQGFDKYTVKLQIAMLRARVAVALKNYQATDRYLNQKLEIQLDPKKATALSSNSDIAQSYSQLGFFAFVDGRYQDAAKYYKLGAMGELSENENTIFNDNLKQSSISAAYLKTDTSKIMADLEQTNNEAPDTVKVEKPDEEIAFRNQLKKDAQSPDIWKILLKRGHFLSAYSELIESHDLSRYTHWKSLKSFLNKGLAIKLKSQHDSKNRYKVVVDHYEFLKAASYKRLGLASRFQGAKQPYKFLLGDYSLIALVVLGERFHVFTENKDSFFEQSFSSLNEAFNWIVEQNMSQPLFLINDQTVQIHNQLQEKLPQHSYISAPSDLNNLSSKQLIQTISNDLESLDLSCDYQLAVMDDQVDIDLRVLKEIEETNSSFNSISNTKFITAVAPRNYSYKIAVNKEVQKLNADQLRALLLKTYSEGGVTYSILRSEKELKDLSCQLSNQPYVAALNSTDAIKLGVYPDPKAYLTAPKREHMPSLPIVEQIYWHRRLENIPELAAVLRQNREQLQQSGLWTNVANTQNQLINVLDQSDVATLASEYLNLAIIQIKSESYEKAAVSSQLAVNYFQKDEDIYGETNALRIKAIALAKDGRAQKGSEALLEAIRTLEDDRLEQAIFQRHLGNHYKEYLSDYAKAMKYYDRSLQGFSEEDAEAEAAFTRLDIANTQIELGNLNQSISILQGLPDSDSASFKIRSRLSLMKALYFNGEYEAAQAVARKLDVLTADSSEGHYRVDYLSSRAILELKTSSFKDAEEIAKEAIEIAESKNLKEKLSLSLSNLAFIYKSQRRFQEARELFKKVLIIDRKMKNERNIAFDFRNIAYTFLGEKNYEEAESYFKKAKSLNQKLKLAYNHIYTELGWADLHHQRKKYDKAIALAISTYEYAKKRGFLDQAWRSLNIVASAEFDKGNLKASTRYYSKALEIIENMQASLKNRVSSSQFRADVGVQAVFEGAIIAALDQDNTELAWQINSRSRARAFVDSFANAKHKESPPEYKNYLKLQQDLMKPGISEKEASSLRKELSILESILAKNHPKFFQLTGSSSSLSSSLRKFLAADTTVIEYFTAQDETIAFVHKRNSIKAVRLSTSYAELKEKINTYRSILLDYGAADTVASDVYDMILEPLEPFIENISNLGIIAHGPLQYLPFASLPYKNQYLIDHFALFHLEHPSMMAMISHEKKLPSKVIGLGNPTVGANLDLPFAEKELDAISRHFPKAEVFAKNEAHTGKLRESKSANKIIHIASHGLFNQKEPKFSKLLLANNNTEAGDLSVEKVLNLDFKSDLTVLSACESGLGDVSRADSMIGLNRAFFLSGSEAVISTLWRIDDVASAVTMKRFYRYLAAGNNKAEALRKAQAVTRRHFKHPVYWSSFRISGDYN